MTKLAFAPVAPGSLVSASGRTYRVTRVLGLGDVLAEDVATRLPERLRVDALVPVPAEAAALSLPEACAGSGSTPDLGAIGEADWEMAQRRFAAIQPLLDDPFRARGSRGRRVGPGCQRRHGLQMVAPLPRLRPPLGVDPPPGWPQAGH